MCLTALICPFPLVGILLYYWFKRQQFCNKEVDMRIITQTSNIFATVSLCLGAASFSPLSLGGIVETEMAKSIYENNKSTSQQDAVLARVKALADELVSEKRDYETVAGRATKVRNAIMSRDYSHAEKLMSTALEDARDDGWNLKMSSLLAESVKKWPGGEYEERLNEWVAKNPKSPIPYILRANYRLNKGWLIRGERYSSLIASEKLDAFRSNIALAEKDINSAILHDKESPLMRGLSLQILAGRGNTADMEDAFQKALEVVPDYIPIYVHRLKSIQPKWGGSVEEMYRFVQQHADSAGDSSPLKILNFWLYYYLVSMASDTCSKAKGNELQPCMSAVLNAVVTDDLMQEIQNTIKKVNKENEWAYSLHLGEVLRLMAKKRGADNSALMLLELATDELKNLYRSKPNEDVPANFMMERISGKLMLMQNNTDMALLAFARAIDALKKVRAPDAESGGYQVAMALDDIATTFVTRGDFEKAAAYRRAADYYGGIVRDSSEVNTQCAIMFRLELFEETVRVCTHELEDNGTLDAALWRGYAYDKLGDDKKAIFDMRMVADSESSYRAYAAQYVLTNTRDAKETLAMLERYAYLFNEKLSRKSEIADAYARRCYAKKLLHKYEEALDDCTLSIKTEPSKYAYSLQRKLVNIVEKGEQGLVEDD